MGNSDLKARLIAIKIVNESLYSKKSFKSIYSKYLNNKELCALDIRFITELSRGTVRMSKRINYEISFLIFA